MMKETWPNSRLGNECVLIDLASRFIWWLIAVLNLVTRMWMIDPCAWVFFHITSATLPRKLLVIISISLGIFIWKGGVASLTLSYDCISSFRSEPVEIWFMIVRFAYFPYSQKIIELIEVHNVDCRYTTNCSWAMAHSTGDLIGMQRNKVAAYWTWIGESPVALSVSRELYDFS